MKFSKRRTHMPIWSNCRVDILYFNAEADLDMQCEVKIETDSVSMVVFYDEGDGPVVYKGKNNGDGHFELNSPEVNGQTSLHMSGNSKILEGFWMEDGLKGMWRIRLA